MSTVNEVNETVLKKLKITYDSQCGSIINCLSPMQERSAVHV